MLSLKNNFHTFFIITANHKCHNKGEKLFVLSLVKINLF